MMYNTYIPITIQYIYKKKEELEDNINTIEYNKNILERIHSMIIRRYKPTVQIHRTTSYLNQGCCNVQRISSDYSDIPLRTQIYN